MKRKFLFLLFVIGIMAIAPSLLHAQSVEEHQTVIDQMRSGNTIRFTLEVERDSALCVPEVNLRECWVQPSKMKKYVYVDVSKTPYIPDSTARRAFLHPDYIYNVKNRATLPADFEEVKVTYAYSGFPWLTLKYTHAEGYYYFYDPKSGSMETKIPIETLRDTTSHIYILWIVILIIFIGGICLVATHKFVSFFNDNDALALPIMTTAVSFLIILIHDGWSFYPFLYIVCGLLFYHILENVLAVYGAKEWSVLQKTKGSEAYISYTPVLYFLGSIGSTAALLFWSVNRIDLYHWVLPILIVVTLLVPGLVWLKYKSKSWKEGFYRVTGW
jgi:hypothetical protein